MTSRRGRTGGRLAPGTARVLLVALTALLAACQPTIVSTPSPTPGPTGAPASSTPEGTVAPPTPVASAATKMCPLDDLTASHGRVEGAAGSRFTTVTLVASVDCSVDAFPATGLRDAQGSILVGAAGAGPGRIDLAADEAASSNVRLANWCAPEPAFPLELVIRFGEEELPVGGGSFVGPGELPPCNGEGGPILEATGWGLP